MPNIKFIQETHTYINEDEQELISVSAFMDIFKKKVDWKAIAARKAKKMTAEGEPTTARQLLKKWEDKRDRAAQIGTAYHSQREAEVLNQVDPIFYNTLCKIRTCDHRDGVKWSIPINKLENGVTYLELMIYDEDSMVCGQADKVIVADNKIHVWDYKTDAEIKFKAFSSEWVRPARYLPPISHLEDCNGNLYSLKMSLYMYMLWKSNKGSLLPGDIIIEHANLKRNPSDGLPVLKKGKPIVESTETIKLPYRKKEVIDMLNAYTKNT